MHDCNSLGPVSVRLPKFAHLRIVLGLAFE